MRSSLSLALFVGSHRLNGHLVLWTVVSPVMGAAQLEQSSQVLATMVGREQTDHHMRATLNPVRQLRL